MRGWLRLPAITLFVATILGPGAAWAARPAIDFFQGPLVSSSRAVGLGGAYVAIAEGAAGHLANPASFAVREPSFAHNWFDWDVNLSAFSILDSGVDYDMSGVAPKLSVAHAQQLAFNVKFGRLGIGLALRTQKFGVPSVDSQGLALELEYDPTVGGVGLAYAFMDGELVLGAMLSGSSARINLKRKLADDEIETEQVSMAEASLLGGVGVLFSPPGQRYRLGCTMRWPVELTQKNAVWPRGARFVEKEKLGDWDTPRAILAGSSFALGFSYLFGAKAANVTPSYGARRPATGRRPWRYLLLSTDLEFTGPVDDDAVGILSYLAGDPMTSGRSTSVSARAGVESEVMQNRLRLRGGAYFEPSRFESSIGRPHVVAGGDVRLTMIWDWSISAVADVAADYRNWSLSLGFWH